MCITFEKFTRSKTCFPDKTNYSYVIQVFLFLPTYRGKAYTRTSWLRLLWNQLRTLEQHLLPIPQDHRGHELGQRQLRVSEQVWGRHTGECPFWRGRVVSKDSGYTGVGVTVFFLDWSGISRGWYVWDKIYLHFFGLTVLLMCLEWWSIRLVENSTGVVGM